MTDLLARLGPIALEVVLYVYPSIRDLIAGNVSNLPDDVRAAVEAKLPADLVEKGLRT